MVGRCPICRGPVPQGRPQNPDAPFCSARCRGADLARWLDGTYAIPAKETSPSEDEVVAPKVRN